MLHLIFKIYILRKKSTDVRKLKIHAIFNLLKYLTINIILYF